MTYLTGALLAATAVEAAAIAALMLERARRGKAELALRLSEERFRLMAGTAPAMIWTARTDTTLDFLNRTCVERMAGTADAAEPELTVRQRDVLRLIVKGQRMKEIAANLGLSVRTVETHKYEMMETLGLHSTADLVRDALDRRLMLD